MTAKYYVDTFGARIKQEVHGRSLQVDLHGLELNITALKGAEPRAALPHRAHRAHRRRLSGNALEAQGNEVERLEELPPNEGRRACFFAATDGSQIELIDKV